MHQIAAQTGLESMHKPLAPMLFPSLDAHISDAESRYPDRNWKEMCGQMAHLVADSGNNKERKLE
jgi:hypothetical protein